MKFLHLRQPRVHGTGCPTMLHLPAQLATTVAVDDVRGLMKSSRP